MFWSSDVVSIVLSESPRTALKSALHRNSSAKNTFNFYKRGYKIEKIFLFPVQWDCLTILGCSWMLWIFGMSQSDHYFTLGRKKTSKSFRRGYIVYISLFVLNETWISYVWVALLISSSRLELFSLISISAPVCIVHSSESALSLFNCNQHVDRAKEA